MNQLVEIRNDPLKKSKEKTKMSFYFRRLYLAVELINQKDLSFIYPLTLFCLDWLCLGLYSRNFISFRNIIPFQELYSRNFISLWNIIPFSEFCFTKPQTTLVSTCHHTWFYHFTTEPFTLFEVNSLFQLESSLFHFTKACSSFQRLVYFIWKIDLIHFEKLSISFEELV